MEVALRLLSCRAATEMSKLERRYFSAIKLKEQLVLLPQSSYMNSWA